jgi:DNA mismatch repair protein MSH6
MIVMFKLGKFYELFYEDAILCNRIFSLKWMGDPSRCHVGFPEKVLDKYSAQLVEMGYKVAVVE